jgi:hypothetical protein
MLGAAAADAAALLEPEPDEPDVALEALPEPLLVVEVEPVARVDVPVFAAGRCAVVVPPWPCPIGTTTSRSTGFWDSHPMMPPATRGSTANRVFTLARVADIRIILSGVSPLHERKKPPAGNQPRWTQRGGQDSDSGLKHQARRSPRWVILEFFIGAIDLHAHKPATRLGRRCALIAKNDV